MKFPTIPDWLIIAGAVGQMFTAFIYPFIRYMVLDWYNDIAKLKPLNHEIAKTYGHYIMGLNFGFGLISLLCLEEIKSQTGLAVAFSGLIAVYWVGRVITQFGYYPMYTLPKKTIFKIGEIGLDVFIISFALIYSWLFAYNLSGYIA